MIELLYLLGFVFFGVNFLLAYKYARYPAPRRCPPGWPWGRWRASLRWGSCRVC